MNQSCASVLKFIVVLGLPLLSGCLEGPLGPGVRPPEPESFNLDGTKWISPSITSGRSTQAYLQSTYRISAAERLLLRFESLGEHERDISLASGRKVEVAISLPDGQDLNAAQLVLELCPLTKNWMMLATWRNAYPMPGGNWDQEGSDYDPNACFRATVEPPITLQFDVTQWVVDYVRGRQKNFGLVLVARNGGQAQVRGDRDSTYSPRIHWLKQP